MRILHYFLGFPPYRSGGLTKFAMDLMQSQVEHGDCVMSLWPGQMNFLSSVAHIKKRKSILGIENYEMINPLPVPLDEGILDVVSYTRSCDEKIFLSFLRMVKPDVIHIHTLMGLYKNFVKAANDLNIRTVYTSHDYFGLCPKVIMFKDFAPCEDYECEKCLKCNKSALSISKIKLMQSPLYRILKNSVVMAKLRNRHRRAFFYERQSEPQNSYSGEKENPNYRDLRTFYIDILSMIDCIHFNSSVAKSVYCKYFTPKNSRIISITHKNVNDNRKKAVGKQYDDGLRLTYLAPARPAKGFDVVKKALDELWSEGNKSFTLQIFSSIRNPSPYMRIHTERFDYNKLENIFEKTDVLLAPSVWYETFGFTVLEALSYGVPVIVSDNVGAKDIVGEGGIIVAAGSKDSLKNAIAGMTREKIEQLRHNILSFVEIKTWNRFMSEMYSVYLNENVG